MTKDTENISKSENLSETESIQIDIDIKVLDVPQGFDNIAYSEESDTTGSCSQLYSYQNTDIADTKRSRKGKPDRCFDNDATGDSVNEINCTTKIGNGKTEIENAEIEIDQEVGSCVDFCQRMRHYKVFRDEFLNVTVLWWSFIMFGWAIAQFGPTFPELRILTKTSLQEASAFVTSGSIGYLVGSFTGGLLLKKIHASLILCVSCVCFGGITAGVPWCVIYELMIVVMFLKSMFAGIIDTVTNTDLLSITTSKTYMQALHFFFSIGGILSPIVTAPFLAVLPKDVEVIASTGNGVSSLIDRDINQTSFLIDFENVTSDLDITTEMNVLQIFDSVLYIPYTLTTGLYIVTSVLFLVSYVQRKDNTKYAKTNDNNKTGEERKKMPPCLKVFLLAFPLTLISLDCIVEDSLAMFLATFLEKQMQWPSDIGAYATAVFWGTFCAGRFIGIFIVRCLNLSLIIILCSVVLTISLFGILLSVLYYFDTGIWLAIGVAGLAISVIFPSIFSWIEEMLFPVTGTIASLLLISASGGTMVGPLLLGYLMDNITPLYFCYLLIGAQVVFLCLFLVLYVIVKKTNSHITSQKEICIDVQI